MKKYISLIMFVMVLAVMMNDGGRLFVAKSTLRSDTGTLSSWASNNAGSLTRDQVAAELLDRAAVQDIELYQYGQDNDGVQLWTRTNVEGLWILGTYMATVNGVPLGKAWGSAMAIQDYAAAEVR